MKELNSSLRISVIDNCNFACLYCPRNENMENYCPKSIRSKKLDTKEMSEAIRKLLNNYKFTKIVITGGEPLLCDDLEELLKVIKEYDNELELDTNGSLYNEDRWNNIKQYIDGVKISLDSTNPEIFGNLTKYGNSKSIDNIFRFIEKIKQDNIPVTINCVCTKLNLPDIENVIKFGMEKKLNVSILDLYYTRETEEFWKENYIDIDNVINSLKGKYGDIVDDDSFGCNFKRIYYNEDNYIKFKSSTLATMRDDLCENCSTYCQEGIFCLRLSRQGWVTTCQSNEEHGVLLTDTDDISSLVNRLENAKADEKSFKKMLERNRVTI